jgi:hypothetical protein
VILQTYLENSEPKLKYMKEHCLYKSLEILQLRVANVVVILAGLSIKDLTTVETAKLIMILEHIIERHHYVFFEHLEGLDNYLSILIKKLCRALCSEIVKE